jgi:very-short-patch-repair endonuclease
MTATEEKLWKYLRAHRLADLHFRRQHQLGPFIADFYCHAARLVVEVDGPAHNSRTERDLRRDQWLGAHGYNVLRFDNPRVWWNLPEVLEEIAQAARICQAQVEGRRDEG